MFPEKYSVMVVGAPEAGVLDFCAYLASYYLKGNQSIVMIEADTSRAFLRRQLRNFGVRHEEYEDHSLTIIDCFSEPASFENQAHFANPSELPEVLHKIKQAIDTMEGPVRIIFDSLSSLHIYNNADDIKDFLRRLIELSKKKGSLTISLHENMHTIEHVNSLISLCDGLIELKADEHLKRFIRISRMKNMDIEPKWMPFEPQSAKDIAGAALVWKK